MKLFQIFCQQFRSKWRLKICLFFSSGYHFVQRSKTVWTILVEDIMMNIAVKLSANGVLRYFYFSSGGHFAQRS